MKDLDEKPAKKLFLTKNIEKRLKNQKANRIARLKDAKEKRDVVAIAKAYTTRELKNSNKALTPAQRLAVDLITDLINNYSMTYVAMRCGIEVATLSEWRNDPIFINECMRQVSRKKAIMVPHALKNINRAITRGSVKDSWKLLESLGLAKQYIDIDDTGSPKELDDESLDSELQELEQQLAAHRVPSEN